MPVISICELFEKQIKVGIWQITESQSELHSQVTLSNLDQERFLIRKKGKHQKSFLASRILLQQMGIDLGELYYENQTIPMLKRRQNISISHTNDYVVIALSDIHQIGIDIERCRSRIKNLAYKFTNSKDYASAGSLDPVAHLTRIWVAKEAMYKAMKKDGVSFKNQMVVHYENQLGVGKHFSENHEILFDLYFREINQYFLCICRIKESTDEK